MPMLGSDKTLRLVPVVISGPKAKITRPLASMVWICAE